MNESLTMNETKSALVAEPETQVTDLASVFNATTSEIANNEATNSISLLEVEEEGGEPSEFEENEEMKDVTEDLGVRNVRDLPKEVAETIQGDPYDAQANVQSTIVADPDAQNNLPNLDQSQLIRESNCSTTSTCRDDNSVADDQDLLLSSEPSERRLFGVGTLTEEVRKLRNQRNKLLSRANLKRRKKRKKSSQNEHKNSSKVSQTRQGSNLQSSGSVNSNSISNSLRHHFVSPLQLSSSVQKMIMSKLNRQQPSSSSNQQQAKIKNNMQFSTGDTNMPQDLFFQHPSGSFVDHQQQNSEALNQWAQSETMPFHAQQNGAKHHLGTKMIPIEIIGLDPTVTKSILHSNNQVVGSESQAQADMSQMYATSHGLGGETSATTPINPVFASELALKDPTLQATRGLRGGIGVGIGGSTVPMQVRQPVPTERPIASSILHIHHFHTQAKPGESSSSQQMGVAGGDELQQDFAPAATAAPTHLREPPTDNPMQMQQQRPSSESNKQQVIVQTQPAYLNDKGELVYLSTGSGGGIDQGAQDIRASTANGAEQHELIGIAEQQTMSLNGAKQLAQQQSSGDESVQPQNEPQTPGMDEQAAGTIIQQQQQLQQRQHLQQFINREPSGSSAGDVSNTNTNLNRNEPYTRTQQSSSDLVEPSGPKHRVFFTTTGQMISVMTPSGAQMGESAAVGGGDDDKLLMVSYKPQHLQHFKNITSDESVTNARQPYNEGQESQSSLISAAGQQLVLRNPSLLIKNKYQQSDGSLADSISQQLATLRLRQQQSISPLANKNDKSLIASGGLGSQLSVNDRASLASAPKGQQSSYSSDNQVTKANTEPNRNYALKSKPTLFASDISLGKGKSSESTAGVFSNWFKSSSSSADDKQRPHLLQQSNGYEGSVFSPTGTLKNNTMNFPTTTVLYKQLQQKQQSAEGNNGLQQLPLIAALTQNKVSPLVNGTTTNLSNDLFAGLLNELKLKNSFTSNNTVGHHFTRPNTTFDFDPVNVTTTSLSQWDHPMPNYVGNLMVRNNSYVNPPKKVLSPYDADKNQRHRLNILLDPVHEKGNLREVKHQSVGASPDELDFGDATNGLSNLALAFIFVVSLLTLTIIAAASMIYRHRRRSIGRCVDLPAKTRLNLTQKTKRFVFNNFKSTNQDVASIKSINLNLTDGNNNSPNKSSPSSNNSSNDGKVEGGDTLINGNTVTKNNQADRISVTQTFGLAPMSTFAGSHSSQFTDSSIAATDIKTIKTRLQKPSYLKSLISTPECPVKLANHKKQLAQKGKLNLDSSCYLEIKHKSPSSSPNSKSSKTRYPNGDRNRQSFSFSKKISSTPCDVHKQNYNFALAKAASSELSFSDRISIDSRMHSDRMSTIHSIDDTNDSKSANISTCEAHGPFKRASNISCRAAKLGNLMAPKHLIAPQPGVSATSELDSKRNRMDLPQMDRL